MQIDFVEEASFMAAPQRFRTAFRGFHREDVVSYIEYLNNQHTAQVEQLRNQLQEASAKASSQATDALQEQLDEALQRCKELEQKLADVEANTAEKELETYRRAERAERQANERARQIYDQANAALEDATQMAESAAEKIGQIADLTVAQLREYQNSISATADSFRNAAATLYAVKSEE
jgi:TolA-binding protein